MFRAIKAQILISPSPRIKVFKSMFSIGVDIKNGIPVFQGRFITKGY